ncbi:hypothetical protein [Pelolinea submarina]|uniref:Transglutaminase superfamily protein n=1 Tax=Pelolinea submarina TaxID=913107 RepID=A0A347ZPE0_9CHLR|nr:hypothetical protein [Pelolinea submarina]REG08772.1 hypothetical protein DFR64_2147 [Pelolinea submarina]BBB47171.1 hypothetical protein Pelsub_P0398 [Pelolinea submarina]
MDTMDAAVRRFNQGLTPQELNLMDSLRTPAQVQAFLDETRYPGGEENRSPQEVLRQRQAHCLDGGLFAAAALRRIGFPPLIVDLQPDPGMDDDHVLAVYKINNFWGAVAKSNYSGLRFREPVYRNLRELVMSYFEDFFNVNGVKTLRYYTRPINLKRFDRADWMNTSAGVDWIEVYLKSVKLVPLIPAAQTALLSPMDQRSIAAGTLGINPEGTFHPKS